MDQSQNDICRAQKIDITSSNDASENQKLGSSKKFPPNLGTEIFDINEVKNGSLHREDIIPNMITSIKTDRWHDSVDRSTSNEKILETLSLGSCEVRMNVPRLAVKNVEGEAILFFEELHLLNIRQLQLKLLAISRGFDEKIAIGDKQGVAAPQESRRNLHEVLHCYRQALDDFEAIQNKSQRCPSHLSNMGGLASNLKAQGITIFCLSEGDPSIAQKKMQSFLSVFFHTAIQFAFAAIGGLALIIPMLIMVFVPGRTSSVVTTCVSVLIFAATLASWSSLEHFMEKSGHPVTKIVHMIGLQFPGFEPKDIVLITATYAAVLMVFVGANS